MSQLRQSLVEALQRTKGEIKIVVAKSSPNDKEEEIEEFTLNDFVLREDGSIELWHNNGYEI